MDVKEFGNFINSKLNSFGTLTLGEQLSFAAIGLGVVLVLIGLILLVL